MYCGRGATSSIVPTHVFRPRAGAQGAQRDAGGRVRIDDGGSIDPWRLRSSSLPMRGPAKLMLRLRGPSRSRITPVLLGGFRAREAIFEIAAVVPLFGLDVCPPLF